jgi:SAM-dependent methyltransferase
MASRAGRAYSIARRYLDAVLRLASAAAGARSLPRYLATRRRYEALLGQKLDPADDRPQLQDATSTSPFDAHYTYQDAWAARLIHAAGPQRHIDVGSRISFVVGLAAFVPTTFIDVRPLEVTIPNLDCEAGTITALRFADQSVESISSLHVTEHIGLGRYGDPLDPEGTRNAARELERVVAPGGTLYFSLPVGRPRTEFNAHRVHDPRDVPAMFPALGLSSFAAVLDDDSYSEDVRPDDIAGSHYACGLYCFTRPA